MGIPMGIGWEWELKFYSHGNPELILEGIEIVLAPQKDYLLDHQHMLLLYLVNGGGFLSYSRIPIS